MRDDLYPDYMEDEPIKKKTVTRVPGQRKVQETDEFEEPAENTEDFQYDQDDEDEYDDSFEV